MAKEDLTPGQQQALAAWLRRKRVHTPLMTGSGLAATTPEPCKRGVRRSIPQKIRAKLWERDRGWCRYCLGIADHIDHVLPLALGGTYAQANLVWACTPCGTRKGAQRISEVGMSLVSLEMIANMPASTRPMPVYTHARFACQPSSKPWELTRYERFEGNEHWGVSRRWRFTTEEEAEAFGKTLVLAPNQKVHIRRRAST